MIELKMLTTREDICEITGLPSNNHYRALWDNGFDLDDWDVCFVSDVPLTTQEKDEDGDEREEPIDCAYWLVQCMDDWCCGYKYTEYGGKHYYMVYHS